MFKYLHVKNKMSLQGSPAALAAETTPSRNRFDDEAEYKLSKTLWGTMKVRVGENVKEAVEALTWDFNRTGITVWWKPHQSKDSSAQVQLMCCPALFDKDGITKELLSI